MSIKYCYYIVHSWFELVHVITSPTSDEFSQTTNWTDCRLKLSMFTSLGVWVAVDICCRQHLVMIHHCFQLKCCSRPFLGYIWRIVISVNEGALSSTPSSSMCQTKKLPRGWGAERRGGGFGEASLNFIFYICFLFLIWWTNPEIESQVFYVYLWVKLF